ncbi:MAG: type II toxin-antitoxin system death-on-curing family toxin [Acidobacteriota bacterium]
MTELRFPSLEIVLNFQTRLIERYGGSPGLRAQEALESALAAPQNLHFYEGANAIRCAAAYAYHLSQAHAFVDGNKRIAWAIAILFLEMNGIILTVPETEAEDVCMQIAASKITRAEVEAHFDRWVTQTV